MTKKRDRSRESYWRQVVGRREKSDLTTRAFCAKEGVSENSFYAWRRELSKRDRESAAVGKHTLDFIPVQVNPSMSVASCSVVEVTHPGGYQLRIPINIDPVALGGILDVLDRREG